MKFILALFVFLGAWVAGPCFLSFAFADPPSVVDSAFDEAAAELDNAKDQAQKLKDSWDKSKIETTLYDKRAKRAYQKWTKAAKSLRDQAEVQKERAELEFQLAVEKRKLAYNEWQVAQLKMMSKESQVKALDQEKESSPLREKIKQMEEKLTPAKAGEGG